MTRRSMPSSFHANLFALVPARCPSSTCGVAMVVIGAALGDVPFLSAVGDTPWARLVHWRCIGWSGNRGPVFGRIPGRGFRMGWVAESATRNNAPKRDAVSPTCLKRKAHPIQELQNGMRFPRDRIYAAVLSDSPLLAQDQRRELVLGVHHVVGAGGFQLCTAAEAPADARTLKASVVAGQNIDIGIAHIECGCRVGA